MLWVDGDLADHGLDHTHVTIQKSADCPTEESDPEVTGKAQEKQGKHGAKAAKEKHRLTTYPIRQSAPVPSCFTAIS